MGRCSLTLNPSIQPERLLNEQWGGGGGASQGRHRRHSAVPTDLSDQDSAAPTQEDSVGSFPDPKNSVITWLRAKAASLCWCELDVLSITQPPKSGAL